MRQCRHARRGIVANVTFLWTRDVKDHKAGRVVCGRPACVAAAVAWVVARANEKAAYRPDEGL